MIVWVPVVAGLWIGDMGRPYRDEFDYVLAISPEPPVTEEGMRLRHVRPPDNPVDSGEFLNDTAAWLRKRWQLADRTVLVQSPGYRWAELVVAAMFLDLGASTDEAIVSLRRAKPDALVQPAVIERLRAREVHHA